MKKLMFLACALVAAVTVNAKDVETASFDKVEVNVPARVRVIQGDTYRVNVASGNPELVKALRIHVANGVLNIQSGWAAGEQEDAALRITVVTPKDAQVVAGRDCKAHTLRNHVVSANSDLAVSRD